MYRLIKRCYVLTSRLQMYVVRSGQAAPASTTGHRPTRPHQNRSTGQAEDNVPLHVRQQDWHQVMYQDLYVIKRCTDRMAKTDRTTTQRACRRAKMPSKGKEEHNVYAQRARGTKTNQRRSTTMYATHVREKDVRKM